MKKVILFDIDDTLFSPSIFIENIFQLFSTKFSLDISRIREIKRNYTSTLEKSTDFDPKDFIYALSLETEVAYDDLYNIFWNTTSAYLPALFTDVLSLLEKMHARATLGIFSEGVFSYQQHKLHQVGLERFFQQEVMYFYRRKLNPESLRELPHEAIIIDNNPDIVKTLQEKKLHSIWLNRKDAQVLPEIKTVSSLSDLEYLVL